MPTPEQLLRKLDERFILGEISQEQYQQMRQRIEAQGDEAPALRINADDAGPAGDPPTAPAPSHAGGMDISDSVIKGNVTSGSASVGNININVGHGMAGGSSAELEYEKCVMLTLRSGGSLESIRRELDDRRVAIGLPIRLAREIEAACLDSCGRKPIHGRGSPMPTGPSGPDPLTRFFKSASESIASMFSNPRPAGSPANRPTPGPPGRPPLLQPRGVGGPPPVPRPATSSPTTPGLTSPASTPAEKAATVKDALKEELRVGLKADLADAVEKDADNGHGETVKAEDQAAATMRKPPPLPAMPPPLQWPGKGKPAK